MKNMKIVALKKPCKDLQRLFEVAENEDIVLELPNGDLFMLSPIDEFEYEIARQRKNKKLMAFLEKRFKEARHKKAVPLDEVFRQLNAKSKKPRSRKKEMIAFDL